MTRHTRIRGVAFAAAMAVLAVGVPPGIADAAPPTPARSTTVDGRFVPPTHRVGNTVVLVVTVPDGRRIELRYPRGMRLAQGGLGLIGGIEWSVRPDPLRCCGRILNLEYTTVHAVYRDLKPIKVFAGAHGSRVRYYHGHSAILGALPTPDELVFQFGPWIVRVYNHDPGDFEDRMTEAELATWARSLDGFVDKYGYLVLRAKAPLKVSSLMDFVLGAPVAGNDQVEIADLYCDEPGSDTATRRAFPGGVAWCDPKTGLHFGASGTPEFVRAAGRGLEVRWLPNARPKQRRARRPQAG